MRYFILILIGGAFICSCNNQYSKLRNYYNNNIVIHQTLADSIDAFVRRYNTVIILRRRLDLQDKVILRINIKETNSRTPIEFDSLLNRSDPYPDRTSKIEVPIEIIKLFKKLKYTSLIADKDDGVFFGDKYDFSGDSQTGIIINHGEEKKPGEYLIRLARNVYVTKSIIP